jgi:hypothetical protein
MRGAGRKAPTEAARQFPDLRQFVFTATGKETDVLNLTIIDVYDNLIVEVDRLSAIEGLLLSISELEIETSHGLALLLGDIRRRMQMILELSLTKREPKEVGNRRKK